MAPAQTFTTPAGSPFRTGSNPVAIVVADFNGDAKPDLAIANYDSNTLTILLGNGAGGFTPAAGSPVPAGVSPISLATADFTARAARSALQVCGPATGSERDIGVSMKPGFTTVTRTPWGRIRRRRPSA